jgi:hypothetical protein
VDSHIHASKQRTGKEYGEAAFAMTWNKLLGTPKAKVTFHKHKQYNRLF